MGQRLAYWIFLGALGFAAFFALRPAVDINAGDPIQQSRSSIESKTAGLARQLGFSVDSLNMLASRAQHLGYYKSLKDSLGDKLPSPAQMNAADVFLNSWIVTIGATLTEEEGTVAFSPGELFRKAGRLQLYYDDQGRVRRAYANLDTYNPTFVPGDSLLGIANKIVSGIFAYDLSQYRLSDVNIQDTSVTATEPGLNNRPLDFSESNVGNSTSFFWQKVDPSAAGPDHLELEIQPKIREQGSQFGAQIRYGASLISFSARDKGEPETLSKVSNFDNFNYIVFFLSLALLAGLVFFKGVKHINKGQVEWKRALVIFVSITLAIFGWRVIFLVNTYGTFLSDHLFTLLTFNFLLMGVVCGMYGALAYIGWEATARQNDDEQLHLIDAFWRFRYFFRETGDGIIRGYALAGVLLGISVLLLYTMDLVFFQHDSQFGYTEPSLSPKLVTINIAGWAAAWLVALGHISITVGFLRKRIPNNWMFYVLTSVIMGFLFAGSARAFGTDGTMWQDILLFSLMVPAIIYTYNKSGLLTVSVGWWIFLLTYLILPYAGSESMDVGYIAWVQAFLMGFPLLFGIASYRYGNSVSEMGGYIPEYQERIANHLRVEKEIEIARESQFKLMPLRPPSLQGVDVYGFFLPSFEVGGDYFDYVISRNGTPESEALTMTIVDVSGKAMKAAMHAVFTSGLLLSRLSKDQPASILREITPTIYHRTDPQTFITCIIAQYNPQSRNLTVANAGHCLPILKREGSAEFISTPHPRFPLGLRDCVNYEALNRPLQEGDFVLLYSDGLPEAVNPAGQRFGFDNLLSLVEELETDQKTCNEIALEIKRRIQKFSDYQLADDTTIICLKV